MFNPQFTGAGKAYCVVKIAPAWVGSNCWGKLLPGAIAL